MYIVEIEQNKRVTYWKKGYVGDVPQTINRHNASVYNSEKLINKIAENLGAANPECKFDVVDY